MACVDSGGPLDFSWLEYDDRIVRTVFGNVKDLCLKLFHLFNLFVRWDLVFNRVCGYRHQQHIVVHGARMFQPFVMMFGGATPWFFQKRNNQFVWLTWFARAERPPEVLFPPPGDLPASSYAKWSQHWFQLPGHCFVPWCSHLSKTGGKFCRLQVLNWIHLSVFKSGCPQKMFDATATMMVNHRTIIFWGIVIP